jgi:molecular chaperone HtpG
MGKMKTSFTGLVKLLAKSLYPEADVFIRELIQNAHDSIALRRVDDPNLAGRIRIFTDPTRRTISFEDNGRGMDRKDIEDLLSTIGRSGTGEATAALREHHTAVETIGQFGIGLLSAFVAAERIDVYTRKVGDDAAWHWSNQGGEDYDLEPYAGEQPIGTRVVVSLQPDRTSHLDEDAIKKTVRKYADFVPLPIDVNGNGPINAIDAPWHKPRAVWGSDKEYRSALRDFVNKRYPDFPLLVIPVDFESPRAKGVLYISDRHVPGINTTGVVDIYQERMAIRSADQELLPDWAKFVRGVIDSPDLQPTAARDNLIKDGNYHRLRDTLGKLIVEALIGLSREDHKKFLRLCDWHHHHLKGMALHNEDFYSAVIDHLPFETNKGPLTLPQIVAKQSATTGDRIPLYYFSYGMDSNQFNEVCDARGLIAINTGRRFDEEPVNRYVSQHEKTLERRQLDSFDSSDLYAHLYGEEAQRYYPLENAVRRALERVGILRVNPTTRRFLPPSMSGVIINSQQIEAREQMEALLNQPFLIEGLGDMADQMRADLRNQPLDLFLNAENPLVQRLATLMDLDDPHYQPMLIGLYNNSVLYSQHRMTPENARIFYHQFQAQMERTLEVEVKLEECQTGRRVLELKILETDGDQVAPDHDWVRLFVMMPYHPEYDELERALREALQRPPYCFELVLARDRALNPAVRQNLRHHIHNSDGYVADISEHSPNVMMELGWVFFEPDFERRPSLVLRASDSKAPPVDLGGHIYETYSSLGSDRLTEELIAAIERHDGLRTLRETRRARFLTPVLLEGAFLHPDVIRIVCETWGSVEQFLTIEASEFARRMKESGYPRLGSQFQAVRDALQAV